MLFQFPYTNLYNLNLDWMIKAIKEMQEIVEPLDRVVNSVNNMTGDVTITKAFLLQILESMVSSFNGREGAVTLTAADVNQTLIDITWTSDPGDVIGDITQTVLDQMYAEGKRVLIFLSNLSVPDTIYFLTLVGNVVTPQIYSPTAALAGVASFNGQTGAVTATGSDLDTANDNDTPISESIENLQTAVSQQSQQIDELGPLNVLTSDSTTAALSAAQGKALKALIDAGEWHVITQHANYTSQTSIFYTGCSVTIPANSIYILYGHPNYVNSSPSLAMFSIYSDPTATYGFMNHPVEVSAISTICGITGATEQTFFLMAKYTASSANYCDIAGAYMTLN